MKRIVLNVFLSTAFSCFVFSPHIQSLQGKDVRELDIDESELLEQYGTCPTAEWVCNNYHPGSVVSVSAFCGYEECFEMNYGELIRVVAADERGFFPKTWFIWDEDNVTSLTYTSCVLTVKKKKTRVEIPDNAIKCRVELTTSDSVYHYHEHFASNPTTGCLGWVECVEVTE